MTIKQNLIKPPIPADNEIDFGTSIAQSIWEKIANYHNWTNSAIPIGYLMYFYASQTLADSTPISPPNPDLWHLCDGSQIVDSNSPLDGQFAPDLRQKFLKGAAVEGVTGGALTINLQHTHGGTLVSENDESGRSNARTGGDYRAGSPHTHNVNSAWSSAEPIVPPYMELQIYIRKK